MKIISVFLFVFYVGVAWATLAKVSQPVQSHVASEPCKRAGETSDKPLYVRPVQTDDEIRRAESREKEADERETRSANATAAQASAAWWQVGIAVAGTFIAAVGGWLLFLTWMQAKNTAEMAEKQLALVHRPKVRVRRFQVVPTSHTKPLIFSPWHEFECKFHVTNVGDTEFKGFRVEYAFIWADDAEDAIIKFETSAKETHRLNLEARPGSYLEVSLPYKPIPEPDYLTKLHYGKKQFFFFGRVTYSDRLKIERSTAFCVRSTPDASTTSKAGEFARLGSPDYEYED